MVGIVSLLGFFLQPNAQTPLLSSLTLRLMLVWVLVFCVVSLGIPSEAVFVTSVLLQLVQAIHREPPKGSSNALSTNNNQNYIFSLLVLMLLLAPIPAPTLIAYFRSTGAIGFSASTGHQLLVISVYLYSPLFSVLIQTFPLLLLVLCQYQSPLRFPNAIVLSVRHLHDYYKHKSSSGCYLHRLMVFLAGLHILLFLVLSNLSWSSGCFTGLLPGIS